MASRILLDTSRYLGIAVMGMRDSGKSAFLEWAGEQYYQHGWIICDLFDAGDYENLFWCVKDRKRYPILLLHPRYVDVEAPDDYVKPVPDDTRLSQVLREADEERRVVCLSPGFYRGEDYWETLARILWVLPEVNRDQVKRNILVLLRESSNIAFSHLRIYRAESQTRKAILRFMRVSRHYRTGFIFDAQRLTDIYKAIRVLIDRIIVKKTPPYTLPEELQFIHRSIEERRAEAAQTIGMDNAWRLYPPISALYPHEFYAVWPDGFFTKLTNPLPSFRHKQPEDSFTELSGVRFTFKQPAQQQQAVKPDREARRLERVSTIMALKQKGLSYEEIGRQLGISKSAVAMTLKRFTQRQLAASASP
jgi:hypothetical protein